MKKIKKAIILYSFSFVVCYIALSLMYSTFNLSAMPQQSKEIVFGFWLVLPGIILGIPDDTSNTN